MIKIKEKKLNDMIMNIDKNNEKCEKKPWSLLPANNIEKLLNDPVERLK